MLKRKIYDKLLRWKQNPEKKCLLIQGARQIGKTFSIREFGKKEYKSFIEINFFEHPEYMKIFEGSLSPQDIYQKISLYVPHVEFIEHNTLIFLDEIQECPNARTAEKFLAIDGKYDIIASGSLLGIHYKKIASIPVGYEEKLEMYSLDFEEFLWAMGRNELAITALKDFFTKREKIDFSINETYLKLLRDYMVVGGMPEAVKTFINTNNYQAVYKTQDIIVKSYLEDIEKYATIPDRQKIKDCYFSIPRQLAKEYTKFQYKIVQQGSASRKYENSLEWLVDAGMIKKCVNVSNPILPLSAYEKPESFKVYTTDMGILTYLYGQETQQAILKKTLVGPAKGGIVENLIADILIRNNYKLRYYKNDNNTQEIEFLIEQNCGVIPIEVKSQNGQTISLNNFIEYYKPEFAYKLISGNIGVADKKITLPLYLAMFI